MNKKKLHPAWLVLLGVILIRGFAGGGINMTSGLFLSPVSTELGIGIGNLSLYFSITSVVMVIWLPFAGKLINRYNIRIMAVIGAALQTFSFAAFGFMNNVYGWYLLAIPHAMGATILVNLLGPILINRWFAKNAGLMMGIQMAFVGLFGAVLQPLASNIIAENGWRFAYYFIGGVTFIVVVVASILFLRSHPKDYKLKAFGADEIKSPENGAKSADTIQISEKTAISSASFYLILLFMICITGVGVFSQHIATYGSVLGYSLQQIGTGLALASIGSAIGSILIGFISDKIGGLKTCYGMICIGILAVVGLMFSSTNFVIFYIATFLHGLVSSGIMVLAPILTIIFYGQKDYEKIYAKVSMGAPLASILLIPVYGFIYDLTKSYLAVLVILMVLLFVAVFSIALGWKKRCTADGCPR
ncbi:MAG: MFS transporter [Oscillospiraceae bacterium]